MMSRYEAILNGNALSNIRDVLITDIQYSSPAIRTDYYSVAKRQGSRIRRRYVDKSSVTIAFMIRAYDIDDRQAICNDVVRWAKNGGVLETNERNGKRLRCVCDSFPAVTSALKWTDNLKITFAAYSLPFWEEKYPATLSLTGTSDTGALYVPGNIDEALIGATITANAAVSQVSLTANGKTMTLSGLSLSSGQTVVISYDDDLIQSIKTGTTSLLNKRTGADDLIAKCGESNSLSVSANASVTVEFNVRGLWL